MKKQSEILQIPIHQIIPDPNQPRQSFIEEENIELALSVNKDGILQPVLVRPTKTDTKEIKYMLVFGHRRLWAAKYNKMANIPAQVKELTDDEALHIQVIENLQRKNINPMEEADAFSRLITKSITTAEQIADELGVSKKYIYDRLALKKAIVPVQDMIRNGKFTISHGKQFARLKKEDQEKLWSDWASHVEEDDLSLSDLRRAINETFTYKLADAIFSTSEAKLIPKAGSCEKCQKRSGCNILLFDDIQQEDICFDKTCYQKKTEAQIQKLINELEAEGKTAVKISASYASTPEGIIPVYGWDQCKVGEEDAYGIITYVNNNYSNYKVGEIIPIKLRSKDQKDDDNDEEDDSNQNGAIRKAINQLVGRPSFVDHDEEILTQVINAAIEKYTLAPKFADFYSLHELLLDKIKMNIYTMNDSTALTIAKFFQVELSEELKDEPESAEISKLLRNHLNIKDISSLKSICLLTELITKAEIDYTFDKEEIDNLSKALEPIGIDLMNILTTYSEKTGYQIPE